MKNNTESPSSISLMPLGTNDNLETTQPQGQYYCSAGSNNAFGRQVAERAYMACLDAGVNVSGMKFDELTDFMGEAISAPNNGEGKDS